MYSYSGDYISVQLIDRTRLNALGQLTSPLTKCMCPILKLLETLLADTGSDVD